MSSFNQPDKDVILSKFSFNKRRLTKLFKNLLLNSTFFLFSFFCKCNAFIQLSHGGFGYGSGGGGGGERRADYGAREQHELALHHALHSEEPPVSF